MFTSAFPFPCKSSLSASALAGFFFGLLHHNIKTPDISTIP
ncbi:hypothetical protein D3OALGA1CA_332 [Olavius algarvensis associated proteobacterium Delta 3]|nr:hypothetical protein D3OALGA1CA_332 [Olavius algarvensis associated proteobacterium Delta 3]CAB5097811.1 hypothetical protein D3OALGB2SA_1627 [Olavius algarvensis associated proteobacterium Delta 3]